MLRVGLVDDRHPLPPQAVVVLIKVPWDVANDPHKAVIELVDADGRSVDIPGPLGNQPIKVEAEFETGRPPGLPKGTSIDVPLTFGVGGGLPLQAGRYVWRLTVDSESKESWSAAFLVRQPPGGQGAPLS